MYWRAPVVRSTRYKSSDVVDTDVPGTEAAFMVTVPSSWASEKSIPVCHGVAVVQAPLPEQSPTTVPTQAPSAVQRSLPVQAIRSSQVAPVGRCVSGKLRVASSHAPYERHGL